MSKLWCFIGVVLLNNIGLILWGSLHAEDHKKTSFDLGEKWAVVIGINDYSDGRISDLRFCVSDARLLATTLTKRCGYHKDNILLITDDQEKAHLRPSKVAMQQQIGNWLKLAEPEDTVLVFFSGHGFLDERGQGFLATQNTDTSALGLTALRTAELRDMLRQCKAQQKMLILDCCHSGGEKSIGDPGPSSEELSQSFRGAGGLITLASCGKKEKSHEWVKVGHGLFTFHLTDGLQGKADFDHDGLITSDELYLYTHRNVPKLALRIFGGKQQPRRIIGEDVIGVFALARIDSKVPPLTLSNPATGEKDPAGSIPTGISVGEGLKISRWLSMRPLTRFKPEDEITIYNTRMSSNGERIIFAASTGTYVINAAADGAKPVQVGTSINNSHGGLIDISADGKKIAWSDRDGLFSANNDGTNKVKMPAGDVYSLRMTADGKSVIIISHGGDGILRMPSDGSNLTRIVSSKQAASLGGVAANRNFWIRANLDVSDDGNRIVFRFARDGFACLGDGSEIRRITQLEEKRPQGNIALIKISGDGNTIALHQPYGETPDQVRFFEWGGKPVSSFSGVKHASWMQVSSDGGEAAVSWNLRFYRRDGTAWRDPVNFQQNYLPPTYRARAASCSTDFQRACLIVEQAVPLSGKVTQLVLVEFNPASLEGMPTVEKITAMPRFLMRDGTNALTLKARSAGDEVKMFLVVSRDGRRDHRFTYYGADVISDDGKSGDEKAYDGVFTHSNIRLYKESTKEVTPGAIVFRVCAYDKHHKLVAVDIEGIRAN